MASARKKQDEKNLKTLRELVSLPHNKYCFDCNQRGPTYVNVTIGSFVCTKCSGMLRGLTPPHRVKSISMATFTAEEVDLVQQRGNEYCRRTWLGLYEGQPLVEGSPRDEQQIHDLMADKYEKRRYYLEPNTTTTVLATTSSTNQRVKALSDQLEQQQSSDKSNGEISTQQLRRKNAIRRPTVTNSLNPNNNNNSCSKGGEFVANFEQADIFQAGNNNGLNSTADINQAFGLVDFANFDNNPVFSSSNTNSKGNFSIFDLQFTNSGPMLNHVPLFPKCNANRWSMPDLNHISSQQKNNSTMPPAPPEDRYLPLKDLDNAFKSQTTIDWTSGSSNGSTYSASVTPSSSIYSSSSPYGSPSQGQFATLFPAQESTTTSNPFNASTSNVWTNTNAFSNGTNAFSNSGTNGFSNGGTNGFSNGGTNGFSNSGTNGFSNGGINGFSNGGTNGFSNGGTNGFSSAGTNGFSNGGTNGFSNGLTNGANPFRPADPFKGNGFSQAFQPTFTNQFNGQPWGPNPFATQVATNGHSNNPFL